MSIDLQCPHRLVCLHREIFISDFNEDPEVDHNPFILARRIKHPKERMRHYMALKKKTYTNEKLWRLKLIESNKCITCKDKVETLQHIIFECPRADVGWKMFEEITEQPLDENSKANGPNDPKLLNIYSLIKNSILIFRDQPINQDLLRYRCKMREKDLKVIHHKRKLEKHLRFLKQNLLDLK